jgi:4-amino-4-deoxy-L-arabinose transferase-like glycosyltransferase
MRDRDLHRYLLLLILLMYLVLAGLFATRTPAWQAPDEPAHYNYIAQLADGELPVIREGDWDSPALESYKAVQWQGVTDEQISAIRYENHQPPLYYALSVPVFALTDGSLTALRLFSALWGVIVIVCAYYLTLAIFPTKRWLALSVAGFVAFQPMHIHILASVNNDSLSWAITAVGLLLAVLYVQGDKRITPVLLGLIVGIGLITKASTYFLAGVMGLAILIRWWSGGERNFMTLVKQTAWFLLPALGLGLVWWLRNMAVYGVPDFLGLKAHDAIVVGQPRTAERIELLGFGGYLGEFARVTFQSFWGQFGWMAVPLQNSAYAMILGVSGVALLGYVVNNPLRLLRRHLPHTRGGKALFLLGIALILGILAYFYYNTEFQQYQARYMFPVLILFGMVLMGGLERWRERIFKARYEWVLMGIIAGLALFDFYLIWRVIPGSLGA